MPRVSLVSDAMNDNFATFTTEDLQAMEEEDAGACVKCGEWAYNVEPDARQYECTNCGEFTVYGSEELVIMGLIDFSGEDL